MKQTQNRKEMAHRINERNSGHWTLDGEPKARKLSQKLTRDEEEIAGLITICFTRQC